jgi:Protein of unknown function (DUF2924)
MSRVKIGPTLPDQKTLDNEIARLRDLDVRELRSRWHNVFGRRPHPHLPRHLLFRVLAYRLQADVLGDLDGESQRLLDRVDDTRLRLIGPSSGNVSGLHEPTLMLGARAAHLSSVSHCPSRSLSANSVCRAETAVPPKCANETRARRSQQTPHEFVSA